MFGIIIFLEDPLLLFWPLPLLDRSQQSLLVDSTKQLAIEVLSEEADLAKSIHRHCSVNIHFGGMLDGTMDHPLSMFLVNSPWLTIQPDGSLVCENNVGPISLLIGIGPFYPTLSMLLFH